jgi:hypothetical protein
MRGQHVDLTTQYAAAWTITVYMMIYDSTIRHPNRSTKVGHYARCLAREEGARMG